MAHPKTIPKKIDLPINPSQTIYVRYEVNFHHPPPTSTSLPKNVLGGGGQSLIFSVFIIVNSKQFRIRIAATSKGSDLYLWKYLDFITHPWNNHLWDIMCRKTFRPGGHWSHGPQLINNYPFLFFVVFRQWNCKTYLLQSKIVTIMINVNMCYTCDLWITSYESLYRMMQEKTKIIPEILSCETTLKMDINRLVP